jgi:hypothetical protein
MRAVSQDRLGLAGVLHMVTVPRPARRGIPSQARSQHVNGPPGTPGLQEQIQFRPGLGWRRADGRTVQHKTRYPVGGSKADGQRTSLAESEQHRRRRRAGGRYGGQVLRSFANGRHQGRRIGQASPELVITDQPAVPGQPAHEPAISR